MEGFAAEDLGAPDSWEAANLDESMRRLLLSAPKMDPSSPDDAPLASFSSSGGFSDEASLGQVDPFLREALEKPRERVSILRMEQDVEKFIRDPTQEHLEFLSLPTSYLRLAAHRMAQHYYLQSEAVPESSALDGSGGRILIRKTSKCRFPLVRLADIPVNLQQEESSTVVKVAIKQRPQKWSQTSGNANSHSSKTNQQKSVEERKEEYNRARARIFSSSSTSSGGSLAKTEVEPTLPDGFQHIPLVPTWQEEKPVIEGTEMNHGRVLGDSTSLGSNRSNRIWNEREAVSRHRISNRVAIFRDRDIDRKDPDYDRSYDRYMQRFDPGFGFNGAPYTIQPMYTPVVNYNTEFPQLGSGHHPQISLDHHPRPIPQHLRGPWSAASAPTAECYGPPEAVISPFSPNHVGAHVTSAIYMHSSLYPVPPRPGMSFVYPHEHIQHFTQTHQQQREASFGLARPH